MSMNEFLRERWLPLATVAMLGFLTARGSAQEDTGVGEIALEAAPDTTTADDAADRYPQIKAAFELFKNKEFKEAEELLKQACADNRELPPAGVIVGTWYYKSQAPALARAAFERAVRDDPTDPEAYVVFGDNAIQQRRFTDAILLYDKANDVLAAYDANPQRKKNLGIRAASGRAAVLEAREQWDEAEEALRSVLGQDAENLGAMMQLARVLFMQGSSANEQESYDVFKKMYSINPEQAGRYELNMARLYQQDGREKNAEKLVLLALKNDPETLRTQLAAATWALESGKMDIAKKTAAAALALDKENVQVRLLQGVIARTEDELPAAEEALRAGLAVSPSNAAVLNQLAITMASQDSMDKRKQAAEFAQMATRLFPDARNAVGRESAVTLAWVLLRLDKADAAKQQLMTALQAGGVTGDAAYMAADIFHQTGQSDVAVRILEDAIENSRGLFPMKPQAEALLQKIKGL